MIVTVPDPIPDLPLIRILSSATATATATSSATATGTDADADADAAIASGSGTGSKWPRLRPRMLPPAYGANGNLTVITAPPSGWFSAATVP
jgi:hypothetical protein